MAFMSAKIEASVLAPLVKTGSTTYVPLELRLDRRLLYPPRVV